MKPSKLAVIVLHWKSVEDTVACVQDLKKITHTNSKIWVIDNDSKDNIKAKLSDHLPNSQLIQTSCNLGYAGGNNVGILKALEDRADYIWVVNPDIRLGETPVEPLLETMEANPKIGLIGPRIWWGSTKWVDGAQLFPENGYAARLTLADPNEKVVIKILSENEYVIGCSWILRSEMIRHIGLLREEFFLYFEEVEYCQRAFKAGWQCAIDARSTHHHLNERGVLSSRTPRGYYFERNRIVMARLFHRFYWKAVYQVIKAHLKSHLSSARFGEFFSQFIANTQAAVSGMTVRLGPIQKVPGAMELEAAPK